MKRFFYTCIFLWLTACSSQTTPTSTPALEPTTNVQSASSGTFFVSVTGASQRTFDGAGVYTDLGEEGIILTLSSRNVITLGSTVQIALPGGVQPGTYQLVPYSEAFDEAGVVKAAGAAYSEQIGGMEGAVIIYGRVTSGTITLQTINPISGVFNFTANAEGPEVTVDGLLNQIPPLEQG